MANLRIMLIDETPERTAVLDQALRAAGHQVVAVVAPIADLYTRVRDVRPDVIIVDLASPNRDTLEHMRTISRELPRPIVMFTQERDETTIRDAVQAGVSAYVVDGLSAERVRPVLEVAVARFNEFQALKAQLHKAQNSLAERKVVERAKGILMSTRGMTEEQAYRTLRKMAMDRNKRLIDVAEGVVVAAELLS